MVHHAGSQQGGQQPRGFGGGSGAGSQQVGRQPHDIEFKEGSACPVTVPALFDPVGPSSSDPVLPHPADAADLHKQGPVLVQPSFACPVGLESSMFPGEKPTERRSLPPARRSPGPRSRDGVHNLQVAQIFEMMKAMSHQLQKVESQVGKLQRDRDPFPFRPLIPYDDDEEDDDPVADRKLRGHGRN